jgi:hypothetical protein
MRGVAGLSVVRRRRKGTNPYQAQSITDALAALRDEPAPTAPVPTFTARRPEPTRETRPHLALAVPAVPAAEAPPMDVLRRVHEGLLRKYRLESFVSDRRQLPLFRALTKELGWLGLHMPPHAEGWQRWSTERWLADRAYTVARAQAAAGFDAVAARAADWRDLNGGAR